MGFTKIEDTDLTDIGVIGLPDRPGLSTAAMQAKLEETSRSVVIPKHNALIDELEEETSATYLGATPVTGRTSPSTVQGVLDKISVDLKTVEDGMAEAIAETHSHPNKALLDSFEDDGTGLTYNGDPVGAVTSVNSQTGDVTLGASDVGALPDTTPIPTKTSDLTNDSNFVSDASYVHTDNNYDATAKGIVDNVMTAVNAKSTVSWNQIDTTGTKIAEVTIDGVTTDVKATGGAGNSYGTIDAGGQSFVAVGSDTFKINAGSNVTIEALTGDKGIKISASGGGQSTGDMLMTDYDSQANVKSAGGIDAYVGTEIGKLDVADSAVSGQYVSAVSETDGKISVSRASLPTVDTTYNASSNNAQSGTAVAGAISTKADASDVAAIQDVIPSTATTSNKLATAGDIPAPPNSGVLNIQQNGVSAYTGGTSFNADSSSAATANIITDDWVATSSVVSGSPNTVTFSGIDDTNNYGYDVYFKTTGSSTNKSPYAKLTTITGDGTSSMSLTYETDADAGSNNAKLRRVK